MYKVETHIHTKESSNCSFATSKELVENLKRIGYSSVVITDHYLKYYFDLKNLRTIVEQIDYLEKGFQAASYYGEKIGLNVLRGTELFLEATRGDYLLYGVTKEFLLRFPELYNYSLRDLYDLCNQYNILLYQAHPFRNQNTLVALPGEVNGIEVYNGNHNPLFNKLASVYAKEQKMPTISGGDRHWVSEDNYSGILTKKLVKTNNDLLEVLREGDYSLNSSDMPLHYGKQIRN